MHINGTSLENMSLKEAKKVVESAKDKLDLKIKRSIAKPSALATMKENNLNKVESTQPPIRPPLPSGMCFVYIFWCLFTNSIYSTHFVCVTCQFCVLIYNCVPRKPKASWIIGRWAKQGAAALRLCTSALVHLANRPIVGFLFYFSTS